MEYFDTIEGTGDESVHQCVSQGAGHNSTPASREHFRDDGREKSCAWRGSRQTSQVWWRTDYGK